MCVGLGRRRHPEHGQVLRFARHAEQPSPAVAYFGERDFLFTHEDNWQKINMNVAKLGKMTKLSVV